MEFALEKVKAIFNAKGGFVSLATTDRNGDLDICPVGSLVFNDCKTLFIIRGPLKQTYKNLKENPNAVFMAVNPSLISWVKFFFTGNFGDSYGYRVYTRLKEEKELDIHHREKAFERYGLFGRLKGGRIIQDTLKKVLVFDIIDVREITPFGPGQIQTSPNTRQYGPTKW